MNGYRNKCSMLTCGGLLAAVMGFTSCKKVPEEVTITDTRELCQFDYDELQRLQQNPLWAKQPLTWRRVPRTKFRVLNYRAGKQSEIAVGEARGSVPANVSRWYGQFQQTFSGDLSELKTVEMLDGVTGFIVDVKGKFLVGKMAGTAMEKKDWALYGVICKLPSGGIITIKMTGPAAEVEKEKANLIRFAKSLKIITKSK